MIFTPGWTGSSTRLPNVVPPRQTNSFIVSLAVPVIVMKKKIKIKVPCPRCREPIEGDESLRGQTVSCPSCKKVFVVPTHRR